MSVHSERGLDPNDTIVLITRALGRVLVDDDLRQRFATACRDVARSYSWEHQAEVLVDVLREPLPRSTRSDRADRIEAVGR